MKKLFLLMVFIVPSLFLIAMEDNSQQKDEQVELTDKFLQIDLTEEFLSKHGLNSLDDLSKKSDEHTIANILKEAAKLGSIDVIYTILGKNTIFNWPNDNLDKYIKEILSNYRKTYLKIRFGDNWKTKKEAMSLYILATLKLALITKSINCVNKLFAEQGAKSIISYLDYADFCDILFQATNSAHVKLFKQLLDSSLKIIPWSGTRGEHFKRIFDIALKNFSKDQGYFKIIKKMTKSNIVKTTLSLEDFEEILKSLEDQDEIRVHIQAAIHFKESCKKYWCVIL